MVVRDEGITKVPFRGNPSKSGLSVWIKVVEPQTIFISENQ